MTGNLTNRYFLSCYVMTLALILVLAGCGGDSGFTGILPPEAEYWLVEPAGTPRFMYLNAANEPVDSDTGKTLVVIEGNPLAAGAAVVSQSADSEHDGAVYLINKNNGSAVSFFFHEDQRFPWKLDVTRGGERINGELSAYNWAQEKFSVTFQGSGGETKLENLKLAQQVVLGYTGDTGLSEQQNTRLRDMYTALGMYESISRALPARKQLLAHSVENTGDTLSAVFCNAALAAFAVTARQGEPPVAVEENASAQIVFNAWGGFGGVIPLLITNPSVPPPPLSVRITTNGKEVNPDAVYYLEQGEEMIFDFEFTDFNGANVTAALYDSETVIYHHPVSLNGWFYKFTKPDGLPLGNFTPTYRVKVKRTMNFGYCSQGYIQLVVFFGQNTIVNGNSGGVLFREPGAQAPAFNRSVVVLHFNVFPDQPNPFL